MISLYPNGSKEVEVEDIPGFLAVGGRMTLTVDLGMMWEFGMLDPN